MVYGIALRTIFCPSASLRALSRVRQILSLTIADVSFSGQLIITVEFAPQRGCQSKHVKKIRSDKEAGKPDGFAGAGELQVAARVSGHGFERAQTCAKIQKVVRD